MADEATLHHSLQRFIYCIYSSGPRAGVLLFFLFLFLLLLWGFIRPSQRRGPPFFFCFRPPPDVLRIPHYLIDLCTTHAAHKPTYVFPLSERRLSAGGAAPCYLPRIPVCYLSRRLERERERVSCYYMGWFWSGFDCEGGKGLCFAGGGREASVCKLWKIVPMYPNIDKGDSGRLQGGGCCCLTGLYLDGVHIIYVVIIVGS